MFVASDTSAVLEHTKNVVYLNDKEIAVITKDGFSVKTLDNEDVQKDIKEITWTLDQIERKGFKHFMLKEIFEQPESLENTMRGRIKDKIKITPETLAICRFFNINPLALISSGSLLIVAEQCKASEIVDKLRKNDVEASIIGEVLSNSERRIIVRQNGSIEPLVRPLSDELWTALSKEV